MKRKNNTKRNVIILACVCMGIILGAAYMFFFSALLVGNDTKYVYIDNDDTIDSFYTKMSEFSKKGKQMTGFKMLVNNSKYADNKELMIIPDAVHTDLYDGGDKDYIPFDKLENFFKENLK